MLILPPSATEVIQNIKDKLVELEDAFPAGMHYEVSYDVSTFLDASIEKVLHTLLEAFILVAAVVFIFLGIGVLHSYQPWRFLCL